MLLFNTQSKKMSGPDPGDFHPTNRIGFNANALGWLKAKVMLEMRMMMLLYMMMMMMMIMMIERVTIH